jgi:hypothetical protein
MPTSIAANRRARPCPPSPIPMTFTRPAHDNLTPRPGSRPSDQPPWTTQAAGRVVPHAECPDLRAISGPSPGSRRRRDPRIFLGKRQAGGLRDVRSVPGCGGGARAPAFSVIASGAVLMTGHRASAGWNAGSAAMGTGPAVHHGGAPDGAGRRPVGVSWLPGTAAGPPGARAPRRGDRLAGAIAIGGRPPRWRVPGPGRRRSRWRWAR